jgi:ATP-dependent DNA helicase RecQ
VLLHAFQDRFTHEYLIENSRPPDPAARRRPADRRDPQSEKRRREADLAKLDIMQRYAYSKTCRRSFILKYFGDSSATKQCEGCDNCLGNHRAAVVPGRIRVKGRPAARAGLGRSRSRGGEEGAASRPSLGTDDARLFEALREVRAELARRDAVPAYVVCQDQTLSEIAIRRPGTTGALLTIRGVGPVRVERYGERFLEVVRAAAASGRSATTQDVKA